MAETCECGRVLCDLCGENRAAVQMKNKLNGEMLPKMLRGSMGG